ncbi:hypothetical protein [Ralstonia phage Reminis]|uniref:Uncharacterized protein n=1 Tax=Ralstonia phage Reminis TaxID=2662139 RepID=A0A5Q2U9G9_9CAUD|nr:hypothetical protein [Ralstonia phage Reminis]
MTKLPQTINKRFNIITGKEVPLGCCDEDYPRASGRTTAIALRAIADAMSPGGGVFVTDHDDYPTYCTEMSAKLLVGRIKHLLGKMELNGFSVTLTHQGARRNNGSYVWGAQVQWSPVQEVFYDLRK